MALKTFQLALAATPRRLSDVYGPPFSTPDPTKDIPYRQVGFTIEGGDAYLGADNTVSSTNWGAKAVVAGQSSQSVPGGSLGPFNTGPLKLSDIWAVGSGATIHIWAVPF